MKIGRRFGIASLLCFVLICGVSFAWLSPFDPDVRLSDLGVEHRDTLNDDIILRAQLRVENRSANTLWIALNEHGLIPSAVLLTTITNRNGEKKRTYVPYDLKERSEHSQWQRISPRQTVDLYAQIPQVENATELVMAFNVHDWRGRVAEVRTPVITAPQPPPNASSQ